MHRDILAQRWCHLSKGKGETRGDQWKFGPILSNDVLHSAWKEQALARNACDNFRGWRRSFARWEGTSACFVIHERWIGIMEMIWVLCQWHTSVRVQFKHKTFSAQTEGKYHAAIMLSLRSLKKSECWNHERNNSLKHSSISVPCAWDCINLRETPAKYY